MARTLKDLLLALLNATLILLALCLFLGWKLAQSVENIQDRFQQNLQIVRPFQEEARTIRADLNALRDELEAVRADSTDVGTGQKLARTLDRLDQSLAALDRAQDTLTQLAETPELLIDRAVSTAIDTTSQRLMTLRGCGAQDS
ncbi:hypothetical protein SAMN05444279_104116 [Ruegeria intermedia]|uniref:Uncharacterized protein n=1 Tax=Ruegeria intermedia TaxID=996115 RepID=A0A1M4UJX0_9RHOB|nr:hypothetical protein [Ruegeria intermedia]SHE57072.1 hypothetical protein SAMN05444279_104116 [Ruegeria intermedia]